MKKTLLSIGSCLGILCLTVPAMASEVNSTDNNGFQSTVSESTDTFSTASTSATSLEHFEIDSSSSDMFVTEKDSEIAQNFGGGSALNNWYAGGSLGIFFPSDSLIKTGFGGSGYVGYQFTPNVGGEIGLLYAGSDLSGRSGDANILSVIASGRYTAPFTPNSNWNYFGTAGVGLTRSSVTAPAVGGNGNNNLQEPVVLTTTVNGNNNEEPAINSRDTSFSFELKGGVGYEFTQNTSVFGQVRYLNISGGNSNYFSTELGVNYKF